MLNDPFLLLLAYVTIPKLEAITTNEKPGGRKHGFLSSGVSSGSGPKIPVLRGVLRVESNRGNSFIWMASVLRVSFKFDCILHLSSLSRNLFRYLESHEAVLCPV